jgi:hypothetical protein
MMEPHFGHDFGNVRIHTDDKAAASARAVNAQAYTVGRDIVFGNGSYAPGQSGGQELLAHELTHVIQQSGAATPTGDIQIGAAGDAFEQEAESNAHSVGKAQAAGMQGGRQAATSVLQKDPDPLPFSPALNLPTDSITLDAGDSPAVENPKLVQLATAFKGMIAANPGAYIKLSTYLSEAAKMNSAKSKEEQGQLQQRMNAFQQALALLGVPAGSIQIEPPTAYYAKEAGVITASLYKAPRAVPPGLLVPPPAGGLGQPGPGPAPAGGGKSISDLLSFKFKAGPVEFAAEIPKSVSAKLPVSLGGAKSLAFELKAETSGDFSFAIALNGLPHVKVSAKIGVKVDKDKGTSGSAGLEISTTKTTCNAPSPESLKTKINAAGEKLKKAMKELETAAPDDRLPKLADIAGAIGEMYDAVEKAKGSCKQVPRATFNFGVQGPLAPSDTALNDPDPKKRPSSFIGGTLTIPF